MLINPLYTVLINTYRAFIVTISIIVVFIWRKIAISTLHTPKTTTTNNNNKK